MKRRALVLGAVASVIAPATLLAQQRVPRIGMLGPRPLEDTIIHPVVLRELAALGYREGVGMVLEYRSTGGVPARAPEAVRELIGRKCDLIFAFEESVIQTLRDVRSPIPVVFFAVDFDPLEKGIVKNPRRPEGNMTGIYGPIAALAAKKIELAQEVLPVAKRFLAFSDVHAKDQVDALKSAAEARGAQLTVVEYQQAPYDLVAGFETGRRAGVGAFIGVSSPVLAAKRAELGTLFLKYRLPAFAARLSVGEPGFLTVGPTYNLAKMGRRTAQIGARILKGAKPAEIPVEQADEFELIVNMKTAKALGVKFPYSVLARATTMIE